MKIRLPSPFLMLLLVAYCRAPLNTHLECSNLQFLRLGMNGTVQCFGGIVHDVVWYGPTNVVGNEPVISKVDNEITRRTDEYNIDENGSLFIAKVTIQHEGRYMVTRETQLDRVPNTYYVNVTTYEYPRQEHPVIESCDVNENMCFRQSERFSRFTCIVKDSRPLVNLYWSERTFVGDKNITSTINASSNGILHSSQATVAYPLAQSPLLSLLVCKASSEPSLLDRSESLVLVEANSNYYNVNWNGKLLKKRIEVNSKLTINCTNDKFDILVWKRRYKNESFSHPISAVLHQDTYRVFNYLGNIKVNTKGVLNKENIFPQDEGVYFCMSTGNTNPRGEVVAAYEVDVYIPPVPSYLNVKGCSLPQYCVLDVQKEGNLTCMVYGIRPGVKLSWNVLTEDSDVSFYYHNQTRVTASRDTFDVYLTSSFNFSSNNAKRTTVECRVVGEYSDIFDMSIKIDVHLINGTSGHDSSGDDEYLMIVLIVVVVVVGVLLLITIIVLFVIKKVTRRIDITTEKEEMKNKNIQGLTLNIPRGTRISLTHGFGVEGDFETTPMIQLSPTTDRFFSFGEETEKKVQFIEILRKRYRLLYNTVQPIPFVKDRMYSVDKLFVECGIQQLDSSLYESGEESWQALNSYNEILTNKKEQDKRFIIEGDPGFGKSTLALQFAYDWCNRVESSPLKDIEIVLFLRLRNIRDMKSIFESISRISLFKYSSLTENDVKMVLRTCSSVVVILDGYDEYSDRGDPDTDVANIIKQELFEEFDVLVMTRSSYVPKDLAPNTQRFRLTGFSEQARAMYIKKAVTNNDDSAVQEVKLLLKENPVLRDLCQVPLFFVIFAHMTHEKKSFRSFSSVTSFFRYMISCFHSHMKNKMDGNSDKEWALYEENHAELDKIAYEGLSGEKQQLTWKKQHMCYRLGERFYEQYIKIGILVEEEYLDDTDKPGTSTHIHYQTDVRFYHKLFGEWYAAHHLASTVTSSDHNFELIDMADLQYVYRFACGISKDASKAIIEYLQEQRHNNKFAILCILERDGKVDNILESVERLVSANVYIQERDNRLLQRSTIQLLEIASKYKQIISHVTFVDILEAVDTEHSVLLLYSDLHVPVLRTLQKLEISDRGRQFTAEEVSKILEYAEKCESLQLLWFRSCILPQPIRSEKTMQSLQRGNVRVRWDINTYLNFNNGCWKEDNGDDMSHSKHSAIVNNLMEKYRETPWQKGGTWTRRSMRK